MPSCTWEHGRVHCKFPSGLNFQACHIFTRDHKCLPCFILYLANWVMMWQLIIGPNEDFHTHLEPFFPYKWACNGQLEKKTPLCNNISNHVRRGSCVTLWESSLFIFIF